MKRWPNWMGGSGCQLLVCGQIYLLNNPLLETPLSRDDVKPRVLGHWGTTPGLNFIYAHRNRVIKEREQSTIYITDPGHGGPCLVANAYLETTIGAQLCLRLFQARIRRR